MAYIIEQREKLKKLPLIYLFPLINEMELTRNFLLTDKLHALEKAISIDLSREAMH